MSRDEGPTNAEHTDNERWYLALTALWVARLRAGLDAPGTNEPAGPDVTFAAQVMGLSPGMQVLDLGCAWGRTTLELARRGYAATGVDISPGLVAIARERAGAEARDVPFLTAAVRHLPGLGPFDAVTEFYGDSVISYEDEAANLAAMRAVASQLRPGGRYLFGTGDYPHVMPAYQRASRREMGQEIVEEILFDSTTMVGTSVRAHIEGGSTATYRRTRRHYRRDQVAALLAESGMRFLNAWCGFRHELPHGCQPEGLVVLAERA